MSSHYVYVIVNKINLKLYFGSHSWEGEGSDPNYYGSGKIIKQAVRKYGKDNFIVYPIKFYDNVDECRKAEEELLTKHNIANNPYCYNIKNGAVGWTSEDMTGEKHPFYGKHLSDETRKKLSQAMTGENNPNYGHLSEEHRKKLLQSRKYLMTPLVAIQIDTGKVKIFESQNECSRVLGINLGSINRCLKGRQKSTGGYLIKYLKRCSTDYKITKRKGTIKLELPKDRKTSIVAIQKDTGKIRVFESQMECARQLNSNQSHIYQCLNGRCKTCKGYIIKYVEQLESGIYEGITGIAE